MDHIWQMTKDKGLSCLDCKETTDQEEEEQKNKIIVNEEGIDININDNGDSFKMKIDQNGIDIKANEN